MNTINVNRLKHKRLKFSNILPTKQPDQQMFLIMHAHFKEKKQSGWDSQVCKKSALWVREVQVFTVTC